MATVTATEVRTHWSDFINRVAFRGERIVIQRNAKPVAALVSAGDAELLEALEDRLDLDEAKRRLSDGSATLAYDAVRAQLGLE